MTERERLVELFKEFQFKCVEPCDKMLKQISENIVEYNCEKCKNEQLADYLLANGVIVPPCKVGGTVYLNDDSCPHKRPTMTFECIAKAIDFDYGTGDHMIILTVLVGGHFFKRVAVYFSDFGKTVFLTKEEAEQVLKGDNKK